MNDRNPTPRRLFPAVLAAMAFTLAAAPAVHAAAVNTTLFNATTNVGGDDPAGDGTLFAASAPLGGTDTVEDAFGNNDGNVEANTFLFANGRTPDNGNTTLGDGGETVDNITWETTSVVILDGYRLDAQPDGNGSGDRGTELARFSVEGEADDLFDKDGAAGAVDRLFAVAQVGDNFQLEVTHTNAPGARIREIDAITTDTSAAVVNDTIFNATTNTGGDDAAGLAFNFSHSALVGGAETVEDAFGNNDGGIESNNVLFADGGTIDNGNNTFGDGGETVSFVQWSTTALVQLDGYRVHLQGDGALEDAARSTELVRFFVDGVLVDIFDANGHTGMFDRLFGGGTESGTLFRLELTRATSGGANGGPRLFEIDALNASVIPTPAALPAGLAMLGLIAARRRR